MKILQLKTVALGMIESNKRQIESIGFGEVVLKFQIHQGKVSHSNISTVVSYTENELTGNFIDEKA